MALAKGLNGQADLPLASGDVVTLTLTDGQAAVFSKDRMNVKELMLLGIPLDPDRLQAADWACLPGLGPALSQRIVADRHKNGAFGSVEALSRVPGIGPGKLAAIRRYF
jgi:competence protein ComEA